jgi:hypothetical protein
VLASWQQQDNKVIIAVNSERAWVNIEKVQKIAKIVRNIELLIKFKNR